MGRIYIGWELMKLIADGEIKKGTKFKGKNGDEIEWNGCNFIFAETEEFYMKMINEIDFLNSTFETIENEEDKKRIDNIKELYINEKSGVRIDIWTHLMRGCIINYVH